MADQNGTGQNGVRRRRRRRTWVVLAAAGVAAAVAAGGAGAGWVRWGPGAAARRYAPVIARLTAGDPALAPTDDSGRVSLARLYPGLTPRDEVIIQPLPDGGFAALFPTSYGSGATLAGRLYASHPLTETDTYNRQTALAHAQRVIDLGSYHHVDLDRRLDEHWYEVSYAMH